MTSLIFGSIYMGHKTIIQHRREKQRVKNYERWEGLRDDYDEQRKISRESRSLDIQRTGTDFGDTDRPILTLRDQQEANDARTSWRPQECFDDPEIHNRRASVEVTAGSGLGPLTSHKTGSTWDEGLPQPLRVHRRTWDDYQPSSLSRSSSIRDLKATNSPRDRSVDRNAPTSGRPSPGPDVASPASSQSQLHSPRAASQLSGSMQYGEAEPTRYQTPGGRMAELIELATPNPPIQSPTQFSPTSPQVFTGYPSTPFSQPPQQMAPQAPQPNDGSMQEWWTRA